MGACAPISDSKDIFIEEDAGFAAVNAAPLKALGETRNTITQQTTSGQPNRPAAVGKKNLRQQYAKYDLFSCLPCGKSKKTLFILFMTSMPFNR